MTLCVVGCAAPMQQVVVGHLAMGTEVRVTAWTAAPAAARQAIDEALAEIDRLEALLSHWRPTSDVSRLNATAGGPPISISAETVDVLAAARRIGDWTNGKFDVTFGALADVWKFDHDRDNRVPTPLEIARRLPRVDYRAVVVDPAARTAAVTRAGVRINLGGIGKGYAVDRAAALLRQHGLHHFMIQFGGDLYVAGQANHEPWRLGLQDPRGAPDASFATVELRDQTFSTSGDYERFFLHDNTRYHHILDPDDGMPARGCRSVTIVAASAMLADGLSTGVFVLGPDAGMRLVEQLPDVEAVIVSADNSVLVSSGLRERLRILRPPTP